MEKQLFTPDLSSVENFVRFLEEKSQQNDSKQYEVRLDVKTTDGENILRAINKEFSIEFYLIIVVGPQAFTNFKFNVFANSQSKQSFVIKLDDIVSRIPKFKETFQKSLLNFDLNFSDLKTFFQKFYVQFADLTTKNGAEILDIIDSIQSPQTEESESEQNAELFVDLFKDSFTPSKSQNTVPKKSNLQLKKRKMETNSQVLPQTIKKRKIKGKNNNISIDINTSSLSSMLNNIHTSKQLDAFKKKINKMSGISQEQQLYSNSISSDSENDSNSEEDDSENETINLVPGLDSDSDDEKVKASPYFAKRHKVKVQPGKILKTSCYACLDPIKGKSNCVIFEDKYAICLKCFKANSVQDKYLVLKGSRVLVKNGKQVCSGPTHHFDKIERKKSQMKTKTIGNMEYRQCLDCAHHILKKI